MKLFKDAVSGGKKITLSVVLGIIILFMLINAGWYVWRMLKYNSYSKEMEKTIFSTWIVPRYLYTDATGYDYAVKYPDYLSFVGNLSVGSPATEENPFTDSLIIWPKFWGGYEYGVILIKDDVQYQIYINPDGTVVNPEDSDIVACNRETIDNLLRRARKMWGLE